MAEPESASFGQTALVPNVVLVDSHLHLSDPPLRDDVASVVLRARKAGVRFLISNGLRQVMDPKVRLSQRYLEVKLAVGLSHWFADEERCQTTFGMNHQEAFAFIRTQLQQPDAVSIGEVGLEIPPTGAEANHYQSGNYLIMGDRYGWPPGVENQVRLLAAQLDIARDTGAPVSCHCGNAEGVILQLLAEPRWAGVRGLIHGFVGSPEEAMAFARRGWFLSLNCSAFYPKYAGVADSIRAVGLEHLLLESDAPGMPIDPAGPPTNESTCLQYVAKSIATVLGEDEAKVARVTSVNAMALFHLAL